MHRSYLIILDNYFVVKDVTPNGSLRRRRSRVPLEEDEATLMDFLRTSNQDAPPVSNIQRKSWGSLGIIKNHFIKYFITFFKNYLIIITHYTFL